jgi:dienelactone hydrolase
MNGLLLSNFLSFLTNKLLALAQWSFTTAEKHNMLRANIDWLRKERGIEKIAAVGYSAGAPWVLNLMDSRFLGTDRDGNDYTVDCGFVADPGAISQAVLSKLSGPLSVAIADEDKSVNQQVRDRIFDTLKKSGWPYQITMYSHVQEGFALRRAVTTKAEVYAKKMAFVQAITWIEEHLQNGD